MRPPDEEEELEEELEEDGGGGMDPELMEVLWRLPLAVPALPPPLWASGWKKPAWSVGFLSGPGVWGTEFLGMPTRWLWLEWLVRSSFISS